eukprot:TRINITY_DN9944_c0_g1_i1.p1 TRINITY_DN9944_c0_g1~~TRINITY_DN9944_c0_g1_i1.p1  ORF type:complete len:430 (+),score=72.27 TRINITY_DN9944_c0_g1_i1:67-1356(+)
MAEGKPRSKRREFKHRPKGIAVDAELPSGPANAAEGEEGRKDGWTTSGSWFVINGEIKIGRDRIQRTTQESNTVLDLEMHDIHPDELQVRDANCVLGQGASGLVKLMHHTKTGKAYAVKIINFGIILDKQMIEQEVRALEMSSPYVVRAFTAFMRDRALHIVQEYMDLGSLSDVLKKTKTVPEAVLSSIAEQVLLGLRQMHEGLADPNSRRNVHRIHRDLKPANLLVSSNGQAKIADFGIATTTNTVGKQTFVGTTTYMSPERIKGGRYGTASDIWSVGLLLVESACGAFPFKRANNFIDLLIDITSTERVALPDDLSDTCKEFLWSCMAQNPDDRPSVVDLLKHPFIDTHRMWTTEEHASLPRAGRKVVKTFVMLFLRRMESQKSDAAPLLLNHVLPFISSRMDVQWVFQDWIEDRGLQPKELSSAEP